MDWKDTIERALWTGVQAPAAVAIFDWVDSSTEIPPETMLWAAGIGFVLSAVKSIGKDRLDYLRGKRLIAKGRHVGQ